MISQASPRLNKSLRDFASPILKVEPCTLDLFVLHANRFGQPELAELAAAIQSSSIPIGRIGSQLALADFALGSLITKTGKTRILTDIQEPDEIVDQRAFQILMDAGIRSIAIIPLYGATARMIGIVTISWPRPAQFTDRELEKLLVETNRLSTAVANYLREERSQSTEP